MRILIMSWPWALFRSNFWIIFAILSEPKLMEKIIFSTRLNKTEGNQLELFIWEHWLAKKLLNNSAHGQAMFSLSNVPILMKKWLDTGNLLIIENDLNIDLYDLVLFKGFIILFEIRESCFYLLASIKDFNSLWRSLTLLTNLGPLLLWR